MNVDRFINHTFSVIIKTKVALIKCLSITLLDLCDALLVTKLPLHCGKIILLVANNRHWEALRHMTVEQFHLQELLAINPKPCEVDQNFLFVLISAPPLFQPQASYLEIEVSNFSKAWDIHPKLPVHQEFCRQLTIGKWS